ncbi:molybdenum cofactor guanylyltransferase [Arenimonas composti]|uniref:Molybdenum cofactor guanylyltransferase n=1 Tax=Arenimonas composti TR7-09 = DSM 18010 TaxID=1121013 RepID=A0A091B4A8_9GAMM|nr:NTP transferase domain-containing protein [Arenimonas composti]KFN45709.1 hypothetical protein P873_02160 [Arenimonas composti TR7-09 = DSM 18010]
MTATQALSLGVLAGGRGRRMGGVDKAWIEVGGVTLLQRCLAGFPGFAGAVLVSARSADPRFAALGLHPVFDRRPGFAGPLAGLEALANACSTPWLLTVPVDVEGLPGDLAARLYAARRRNGAVLADAVGLQPLVALWSVPALRTAAASALDAGHAAARDLVAALDLAVVDIAPATLRNRNTPEDLQQP